MMRLIKDYRIRIRRVYPNGIAMFSKFIHDKGNHLFVRLALILFKADTHINVF